MNANAPERANQSEAARLMRPILKSQYHAALAMLRDAVERCPDSAWTGGSHTNACWQLAYHVLYFTHLYLQQDLASFRPWHGHQADVQHEDGLSGRVEASSTRPLIPQPYTRAEVLAYCGFCDAMVDDAVDGLDLDSPESGFSWYKVSKLEHQIINLRHLQHHTAQLADRVRSAANAGVRWVGARRVPIDPPAGSPQAV